MDGNDQVQSVTDALDAIERWAEDERAKMSSEIAEVDNEMAQLDAAILNLKQQHEALARLREDIVEKSGGSAAIAEKYYESIFTALVSQAHAANRRAELVQAAEAGQKAALALAMNTPEIAALQAECEQFRSTIEPTLDSLPESYRGVLMSHHATVEAKLAEHMAKLEVGPVEVEGDILSLNLVYAVDPSVGEPEILTVVFPVEETVYVEWEDRPETILTRLATSVVQAIYQVCQDGGLSEPEGAFGGHQGLLAMEVDVLGASDGVVERLAEAVATSVGIDPGFSGAKIRLDAIRVEMDHLLPREEDEEDAEV
jgi:hypothetical protein